MPVLGTGPLEWVTGLSTAGALLVAFTVFAFDLRERTRRQASGVATWIEHRTDSRGMPVPHAVVTNASEYPVYEVWLWDGTMWDEKRRSYRADVGTIHDELWPVIGPGKTIHCGWPLGGPVLEDPWLVLTFNDSASRIWQRHGSKLRRLRSRPDVKMKRWEEPP